MGFTHPHRAGAKASALTLQSRSWHLTQPYFELFGNHGWELPILIGDMDGIYSSSWGRGESLGPSFMGLTVALTTVRFGDPGCE